MYIVWGTKRKEKRVGYVADFCPICREVRAFDLVRVGLAGHLYYISFGSGKLAGHLIRCQTCQVAIEGEPGRYASIAKQPLADLGELQRTTFPGLQEFHGERLALEGRMRNAPRSLTSFQRAKLAYEPFEILHHRVEARFTSGGRLTANDSNTQLDGPSGIGCIGTILVTIVLLAVAASTTNIVPESMIFAGVGVVGCGILYTFVQLHFAPNRFLQNKVLPQLARTLEPLHLTEAELEDTLARCRVLNWKIGTLEAGRILGQIEQIRKRIQ